MDTHKKSATKAISWRILASTDTFLISWLITGSIKLGASIMSIEVITKMALYYFHERAWNKFWRKKTA